MVDDEGHEASWWAAPNQIVSGTLCHGRTLFRDDLNGITYLNSLRSGASSTAATAIDTAMMARRRQPFMLDDRFEKISELVFAVTCLWNVYGLGLFGC